MKTTIANKMVKKLAGFTLFLALLLSVGMNTTKVNAATETYKVKSKQGETKTFVFKAPEAKTVRFELIADKTYNKLGKENTSSLAYLQMTVKAGDRIIYSDYQTNYTKNGIATVNMNFAKGTTIKVKVTAKTAFGTAGKMTYRLKCVTSKTLNNFEIENNNSRKRATELTLNKEMKGILYTSDVDYFVFTAPQTGYYRVYAENTRLNPTGSVSNTVLIPVSVYQGSVLLGTEKIRENKGATPIMKEAVKLTKGQKIYVRTERGDLTMNWDKDRNITYKIKVKRAA